MNTLDIYNHARNNNEFLRLLGDVMISSAFYDVFAAFDILTRRFFNIFFLKLEL